MPPSCGRVSSSCRGWTPSSRGDARHRHAERLGGDADCSCNARERLHQRRRQHAAEVADERRRSRLTRGPPQDVVAADARAALIRQREERAVQAQPAEVERRPAHDLAGGAARVRVVLAGPTARGRRGAGGPRRRRWSRGAGRRSTRVRAGSRLEHGRRRRPPRRRGRGALAGRTAASEEAEVLAEPGADGARERRCGPSPARPTEWPRWPRQSSRARSPPARSPSRRRGRAARSPPCRRRARLGRRRQRADGRAPRGVDARSRRSSPAKRLVQRASGSTTVARSRPLDRLPAGRRRPRRRPRRATATGSRPANSTASPLAVRLAAAGAPTRASAVDLAPAGRRRRTSPRRAKPSPAAGRGASCSGPIITAAAAGRPRRRCPRRRTSRASALAGAGASRALAAPPRRPPTTTNRAAKTPHQQPADQRARGRQQQERCRRCR